MKQLITIFAALCCFSAISYAQAPQLINYQAVARNAAGQPFTNQAVSVRLTVRQSTAGGTVQYQETHNVTTSAQGLLNVQIGGGTPNTGTFAAITWTDGQPKFLQTELDPDGAAAQPFVNMGTQQLVSVPYALYGEETKWVKVSGENTRVGNSGYSLSGTSNTATGFNALSLNTTGNYNTANGVAALNSNTTGYQNTANGSSALYSNTTGNDNTANGVAALISNTTGNNNTANGSSALALNTTGYQNTANGISALLSNTTGHDNTANGSNALSLNTTGNYNTATGVNALSLNTTGIANTAVGTSAFPAYGSVSNYTGIGFFVGTGASGSNMVEIGNTSVSVIRGQVDFSTYSDARIKENIQPDVPGLAFISQLKPVTYNLNVHRQNQMMYSTVKPDTTDWEGKYDIEKIRMTGFLAQDVEKAAQNAGFDFSGVVKPQNEHDLYSLRYAEFVVPLVKAVQEQQAVIETQNKTLAQLQQENQQMKAELAQIKAALGLK